MPWAYSEGYPTMDTLGDTRELSQKGVETRLFRSIGPNHSCWMSWRMPNVTFFQKRRGPSTWSLLCSLYLRLELLDNLVSSFLLVLQPSFILLSLSILYRDFSLFSPFTSYNAIKYQSYTLQLYESQFCYSSTWHIPG